VWVQHLLLALVAVAGTLANVVLAKYRRQTSRRRCVSG
jgi:hypothetical protein